MADWTTLFAKPAHLSDGDAVTAWFDRIADQLLNHSRLIVAQDPHRFTEIEFYYHGPEHLDIFAHRDPLQLECGRWYFHKTGGVYRSGSFKGFDLTFGDGTAHGGILIRGIEKPDGELVDGPSLCVDHLLGQTGHKTVSSLDQAIAGRPAWDFDSPVTLAESPVGFGKTMYRCGRVGLSLKKHKAGTEPGPKFIMRRYRYLSEPKRIKKGKQYLVLGMHVEGRSAEVIAATTGTPKGSVAKYIADFEAGRKSTDFTPYFGAELGPKELCQLHGTWAAAHGPKLPEPAPLGEPV